MVKIVGKGNGSQLKPLKPLYLLKSICSCDDSKTPCEMNSREMPGIWRGDIVYWQLAKVWCDLRLKVNAGNACPAYKHFCNKTKTYMEKTLPENFGGFPGGNVISTKSDLNVQRRGGYHQIA